MYGQAESSRVPRTIFSLSSLLGLLLSGWILVGGGHAWPGLDGDPTRRWALLALASICFLRFAFLVFTLLRRRMGWPEAGTVSVYLVVIYLGYALGGAGESTPMGPVDFGAIGLYLLGCLFNTGGELQRFLWKRRPENKGKLYTRGFFRLARHINYFGDTLWMTGWAILTRNPWTFLLPAFSTAGFVFHFIPTLTRYLRERYGEEFEEYARRTKRFIPFLY